MQNIDVNPTKPPAELAAANQPAIDLASPGMAKALARRLKDDIDDYCIKTYDDGHRSHLGASLIGNECSRYLWYIFRWCGREKQDARMLRLWNRGHREEIRYVEFLRGIGCQVWQYEDEATEKQFRFSAVNGHFGGSLDAVVKLPPKYNITEPLLGEFKTNNTGRGWAELCSSGMALNKSQHFAQTSLYGKAFNFRFVAYFNTNKNDDDLYIEVVRLDWTLADQLLVKAEQIITSHVEPPRLSDNPTFMKCSFCAFKEICHFHKAPERNCRSCFNCKPVDNAQWYCAVWQNIVPKEFIPKACDAYHSITGSN